MQHRGACAALWYRFQLVWLVSALPFICKGDRRTTEKMCAAVSRWLSGSVLIPSFGNFWFPRFLFLFRPFFSGVLIIQWGRLTQSNAKSGKSDGALFIGFWRRSLIRNWRPPDFSRKPTVPPFSHFLRFPSFSILRCFFFALSSLAWKRVTECLRSVQNFAQASVARGKGQGSPESHFPSIERTLVSPLCVFCFRLLFFFRIHRERFWITGWVYQALLETRLFVTSDALVRHRLRYTFQKSRFRKDSSIFPVFPACTCLFIFLTS